MSTVAQSFANIVKTNNGFFKSAAQAGFLLSQCVGNEFVSFHAVGRNVYTLFYTCDQQGVTRVQKQTVAKGLVLVWERVTDGQVSIQVSKEIKRIQRLIKQTEKSMAERAAARAAGQYPNELLFSESQEHDQRALQELNRMLSQLT